MIDDKRRSMLISIAKMEELAKSDGVTANVKVDMVESHEEVGREKTLKKFKDQLEYDEDEMLSGIIKSSSISLQNAKFSLEFKEFVDGDSR